MIDDKEQQALESDQLSQSHSKTWRYRLDTALVAAGLLVSLVVLYVLIFEGVPALRSWKTASDKTAQGYGKIVDEVSPEVIAMVQDFHKSATHIEKASDELLPTIREARNLLNGLSKEAPEAIRKVGKVADAGALQLAEVGGQTRTLIANSDTSINGKDGVLAESHALLQSFRQLTEKEVKDAIAEMALTTKNVRIITDDPALKSLPAEIDKMAKSLNRSAGKVEVTLDSVNLTSENIAAITGNLKTISDDSAMKFHSLLNPPPAPFWKKYILYPLKDAAGISYLLIKIANGL